jgi:hypothetical protein
MVIEEDATYEGRIHGFSLALATMYLTRANKSEVYTTYDAAITNGELPNEAVTVALRLAGKYDSCCQACNLELGEEVTALCGMCLLHHGGILEFFETKPDDYDLNYMETRIDLPWAWLQNDD